MSVPSFTVCRQSFSAWNIQVLAKYNLKIGSHLELLGYKEVKEKNNNSMADILNEASFSREEIIEWAAVIDESNYKQYDKNGDQLELNSLPSEQVIFLIL